MSESSARSHESGDRKVSKPRRAWKRWILVLAILVVILSLVSGTGFYVSSQSPFCGSCHIMTPYMESWESSAHADVECVTCHLPPSVKGALAVKMQSVTQLAKYAAGTYGQPWAELDDGSCLRSGCHSIPSLATDIDLAWNVRFDHEPHLSTGPAGFRLRCSSCHTHVVEGEHFTVQKQTCYQCHLRDLDDRFPNGGASDEPESGQGECSLCHDWGGVLPADSPDSRYDHSFVVQQGMSCRDCHPRVVEGQGEVRAERCRVCHDQPDLLGPNRVPNADLHRIHITDGKAGCHHCHDDIRHRLRTHERTLQGQCQQCHPSRHEPVLMMMQGQGLDGVTAEPDEMFAAGLRCEACHRHPLEGEAPHPGAAECMACHGPKYDRLFHTRKAFAEHEIAGLSQAIEAAAGSVDEQAGEDIRTAVETARRSLSAVRVGGVFHNFEYAVALFSNARQALEQLGEASPELPGGWIPYETSCSPCHAGIAHSAVDEGRQTSFSHQIHAVDEEIDCTDCHFGDPHEEVPVAREGCGFVCH